MKILCICEHGNNRSCNLATHLKYEYYAETIATGTRRVSNKTMKMLCEWADHIIVIQPELVNDTIRKYKGKLQIWDLGPDIYPRPYNTVLDAKCRELVEMRPLS